MIEVIRSGKRYEIDCECCGARLRFSKADEMHYGTSSFIICPECNKNVDTDCATEITHGEELTNPFGDNSKIFGG